MSPLETQQRGLLDLVKGRGGRPTDPYLRRVAHSPELAMVRSIALWWRAFELERQCPFTAKFLKREGRFAQLVAAYFDENATSPFAEEVSVDFLLWLEENEASPARTIARFDRAILELRTNATDATELCWDRHPGKVIAALENGGEVPPAEPNCVYHMWVLAPAPGRIECVRESTLILHRGNEFAGLQSQPTNWIPGGRRELLIARDPAVERVTTR